MGEYLQNIHLIKSQYIKYRLNRLYDIYFPLPIDKDSNFYRSLQEYWIIEFERKEDWKLKLKYDESPL